MPYNIDGTGKGGQGGGGGVGGGGGNKQSKAIGGSPGLLTSTGGLTGLTGACYQPFFNPVTNSFYVALVDSNNFNCEEDGFYQFPEPDAPNGVGRKVTIHKAILTYREIGVAKFTLVVNAYVEEIDDFVSVSKVVTIAPPKGNKKRAQTFPDGKIHTQKVSIVITGERPEPFIKRNADDGPFSIVKLVLCGNASEEDQL